jgi:hypothetical protein
MESAPDSEERDELRYPLQICSKIYWFLVIALNNFTITFNLARDQANGQMKMIVMSIGSVI